jgi:hypothetical protein
MDSITLTPKACQESNGFVLLSWGSVIELSQTPAVKLREVAMLSRTYNELRPGKPTRSP